MLRLAWDPLAALCQATVFFPLLSVVGKAFLIIISLSLSNYNHFKLFLRGKKSQTCNQYAEEIHGKFFYWSDNTSNCSFCFSFSQFSLMGMKRDHRLFIVGGGRSQSISCFFSFFFSPPSSD